MESPSLVYTQVLKSRDGDGEVNLGRTRECCSSDDLSLSVYSSTS